MRPLHRVLHTAHFCPSPDETGAYIPCDASAPGAVASTYAQWRDKRALRALLPTPQDYLDALQTVHPSVHADSLPRWANWETTLK